MSQLEFDLGRVRFMTDTSRLDWIRSVRRIPMCMRNDYDEWPLPKLISDEDMETLYQGQRYEDVVVKETNTPIAAPSTASRAR